MIISLPMYPDTTKEIWELNYGKWEKPCSADLPMSNRENNVYACWWNNRLLDNNESVSK